MDPLKIAEMMKQFTENTSETVVEPEVKTAEPEVKTVEPEVKTTETASEKVDPIKLLLEEFANLKQSVLDIQKGTKKPAEPEKKKDSYTIEDLTSLIEQTVEKKTKENYINSLTGPEKEYIKSIPGNESFSQATINAILSKKGLPKITSSTPVAKEDSLDDLIKKIRGMK